MVTKILPMCTEKQKKILLAKSDYIFMLKETILNNIDTVL